MILEMLLATCINSVKHGRDLGPVHQGDIVLSVGPINYSKVGISLLISLRSMYSIPHYYWCTMLFSLL